MLNFVLFCYFYLKKPPLLDRNIYSSINHNYSKEAKLFSEKLISYWSNFVRNGDPNSLENGYFKTWLKFTGENYLSFSNKENKMMSGGIATHKCRFWDDPSGLIPITSGIHSAIINLNQLIYMTVLIVFNFCIHF